MENIKDHWKALDFWNEIVRDITGLTGKPESEVIKLNIFQRRLIWKLQASGKNTRRIVQISKFIDLRESLGENVPEDTILELHRIFMYRMNFTRFPVTGTTETEKRFSKWDARVKYDPFKRRKKKYRGKYELGIFPDSKSAPGNQ